ncbi:NTP transferase domain-containing protein [Cellulomonas sp.]|uniref:molybdenum cofactor guanylyltransferase n=1 Tax=Cellulomonas sp. TaxID=40001 RepID=UPI0025B8682D|nr:NTP transferase domain-containing protein [Cellulomonas sp.]
MAFDAIVLAGGRGRRLVDVVEGTVKPEVLVGGTALVDHALAAVAGARRVVLVAPPQVARPGVVTVLEDPPDGGPVAGLAAGLAALQPEADGDAPSRPGRGSTATSEVPPGSTRGPRLVVVLACDVPHAARALPALLAAASDPAVDGARLVSTGGRPQHLVAAYDRLALDAAVAALPSVRDAAVRRLVEPLHLVDVPDTVDAAADADTWDDVARLDDSLTRDTIDQRTHETDGAPHE